MRAREKLIIEGDYYTNVTGELDKAAQTVRNTLRITRGHGRALAILVYIRARRAV